MTGPDVIGLILVVIALLLLGPIILAVATPADNIPLKGRKEVRNREQEN